MFAETRRYTKYISVRGIEFDSSEAAERDSKICVFCLIYYHCNGFDTAPNISYGLVDAILNMADDNIFSLYSYDLEHKYDEILEECGIDVVKGVFNEIGFPEPKPEILVGSMSDAKSGDE